MSEKKLMMPASSFYKKYSSFIVLFVLLVSIVGIVWFGIAPLKRTIADRMRNIQEFYVGQENREKQVKRLPELKEQYDIIAQNEPTLGILIAEDQIVDVIKTLEGLAGEMNVQMTITSKENGQIIESKKIPAKAIVPKGDDVDAPAETANAKSKVAATIMDDAPFDRYLRLSVVAAGQYANIVTFLRKIETLPIGLDVVGVEVEKADEEAKKNQTAARAGDSPFISFGNGVPVVLEKASQAVEKDFLEATFDVLVYVNKKD